jgi:hypothetical protein
LWGKHFGAAAGLFSKAVEKTFLDAVARLVDEVRAASVVEDARCE